MIIMKKSKRALSDFENYLVIIAIIMLFVIIYKI